MKNTIDFGYATTHKASKVKDKIKECETALSVIQSALIWIVQHSDISINKVFKESLRNKYVGYWISKTI